MQIVERNIKSNLRQLPFDGIYSDVKNYLSEVDCLTTKFCFI